jgi:uncharacterized protein (DUF2252 family)
MTSTARTRTAEPTPVVHLSVTDRVTRGKAARAEVPRSAHAAYEPPARRGDPIRVLQRQDRTRVPDLVPIRYGRMLVSPFAFYRGGAAIMARDLAGTPRSGLTVQCCGDAHLSNFGAFASPERRLIFDVNDFDETLPGPWEWDVKRLAASMTIAAAENGFSAKQRDRVTLATVEEYRTAMRRFAAMNHLDVWYAHLDVEDAIARYRSQLKAKRVARVEKQAAKARTRDSMSAFSKLCHVVDGRARIVDESPLIVPVDKLVADGGVDVNPDDLERIYGSYRDTLQFDRRILLEAYEMHDLARKVVGVGSVGTRSWIVLLMGRDTGDPLFLQMKEAQASVLEPYVGPSEFANHGERVVTGQRVMQASSDIFLGWMRVPLKRRGRHRDFYARQLRDWKLSVAVERMTPDGMATYGRLCGWTLARAHARSGDRIAIAAYLGGGDAFDRALLAFSTAYAEQNARDYAALVAAVEDGRVKAQNGL